MNDHIIEPGTEQDLDEIEALYNTINDYLAATTNYPGWIKGIYPTREDAAKGIKSSTLYTAKYKGAIAGSIIINHEPEALYFKATWKTDANYSNILVIHTLTVHPKFMHCGIGKMLLDYAVRHAAETGVKSIRLDVYEKNLPAIQLYKKCGFEYIDKVDLGYGHYGLDWFCLYEKLINKASPR